MNAAALPSWAITIWPQSKILEWNGLIRRRRQAIKWTQGVLSPENGKWLATLDYEHREADYLLVHGAPHPDYFAYIADKDSARRAFGSTDATLIFIGHTHLAEMYALAPDGTIAHRHFQYGGTAQLEEGYRYIINAGSVGQPRDLESASQLRHLRFR